MPPFGGSSKALKLQLGDARMSLGSAGFRSLGIEVLVKRMDISRCNSLYQNLVGRTINSDRSAIRRMSVKYGLRGSETVVTSMKVTQMREGGSCERTNSNIDLTSMDFERSQLR